MVPRKGKCTRSLFPSLIFTSILFLGFTISYAGPESIPDHIKDVVFIKSRFSEPIIYPLPQEDNPGDKVEALNKFIISNPNAPIYGHFPMESAIRKIDNLFLSFLKHKGLIKIERFAFTDRHGIFYYDFFYYPEKMNPFIYKGNYKSGPFEVIMASRVLKSIHYMKEDEESIRGLAVKVFALTFSYYLENKIPDLPKIEKIFKGKAKAYLDPDDGKWKNESFLLEDQGDREFFDLLRKEYWNK